MLTVIDFSVQLPELLNGIHNTAPHCFPFDIFSIVHLKSAAARDLNCIFSVLFDENPSSKVNGWIAERH